MSLECFDLVNCRVTLRRVIRGRRRAAFNVLMSIHATTFWPWIARCLHCHYLYPRGAPRALFGACGTAEGLRPRDVGVVFRWRRGRGPTDLSVQRRKRRRGALSGEGGGLGSNPGHRRVVPRREWEEPSNAVDLAGTVISTSSAGVPPSMGRKTLDTERWRFRKRKSQGVQQHGRGNPSVPASSRAEPSGPRGNDPHERAVLVEAREQPKGVAKA